jgi:hypothetical protein
MVGCRENNGREIRVLSTWIEQLKTSLDTRLSLLCVFSVKIQDNQHIRLILEAIIRLHISDPNPIRRTSNDTGV